MNVQLAVALALMVVVVVFAQRVLEILNWLRQRREWTYLARRLGFQYKLALLGARYVGHHKGLPVEATRFVKKPYVETWVRVDCLALVHPELTACSENAADIRRLWRTETVVTGDTAFDDAVFLQGPERYWLAILDEQARLELRSAVDTGIEFTRGVATFRRYGDVTVRDFIAMLDRVHRTAQVLVDIARQVEHGASLRSAALLALIDKGQRDAVEPLIEDAVALRDDALRASGIRAMALVRGAQARDTLLRLLRADVSPNVQLACAETLGALGDKLTVEALQRFADGTSSSLARLAAQKSVRQIQYRLGRVGEGRVSLAESVAHVGAVSEPLAESGAVSEFATDRKRQES